MKITREQLKEIVREVMTEESEYQTFFKKALEKTGKSIPQMSDEEKKSFFNKIDAAWKGKGEKKESVNEAMNLGDLPRWVFDDPVDFEDWYDDGMELNKKGTKLAPLSKSDEKKLFDLVDGWVESRDDKRAGHGSSSDVNNQIKNIQKFLKQKGKVIKESVNEEKYTVIDPKGNSLGSAEKNQVVMAAKKRGGEKAGYFVVSAKNALKARRALEKFKGDFKNPKLKDIMSGLYESVNESLLKEWKLEVDLGKVNPKRFDRFVDKSFQKSFKIDVAGSDSNRVIIGRGKDDSEGISAGFLADKLEGEFGNKIKMKIDGKPLKFRGL